MTIEWIGDRIIGLSSDTKPTNPETAKEFIETDTGRRFKFTGSWVRADLGMSREIRSMRLNGQVSSVLSSDIFTGIRDRFYTFTAPYSGKIKKMTVEIQSTLLTLGTFALDVTINKNDVATSNTIHFDASETGIESNLTEVTFAAGDRLTVVTVGGPDSTHAYEILKMFRNFNCVVEWEYDLI